jgi:hypothetical protein
MKVVAITELIQTALQNDKEARKTGKQGSASMSADTEPVTSIINRRSQPVDVNGAEQNAKLTISRAAIKTDRITPTEQGDAVTILDSGRFITSHVLQPELDAVKYAVEAKFVSLMDVILVVLIKIT